MRQLEPGVRPEDQANDPMSLTPVEDRIDERPPRTLSAQVRVEIQTVELGMLDVEPLDAHRADDSFFVPDDEERARGRFVTTVEAKEIRNFADGIEDEAVFPVDATDEVDDPGNVSANGG